MLRFTELRKANQSRAQHWHRGFPYDSGWSIADWSNAMAGEAGEACNVVKKMRRIDLNVTGRSTESDREVLRQALADELADVIMYADLLATKEGIDLWSAVVRKFNRTSGEYGFPERLF